MQPDETVKVERQSAELESLMQKADHLNTFGTLTSLVSSFAYFVENTFGKNLPRWVNGITLAGLGAGIIGVAASFYYKLKAGRIAIYSTAHIGNNRGEAQTQEAPSNCNHKHAEQTAQPEAGTTNWVGKQAQNAPQQPAAQR